MAGVLLGATGSFTPMILLTTTGFVAAGCVLLIGAARRAPRARLKQRPAESKEGP
jgi:hypothetical protein